MTSHPPESRRSPEWSPPGSRPPGSGLLPRSRVRRLVVAGPGCGSAPSWWRRSWWLALRPLRHQPVRRSSHDCRRQLVSREADRCRRRPDRGVVRVGGLLRRRRFRRERLHGLEWRVVGAASAHEQRTDVGVLPDGRLLVATSKGSFLYTYSGGKWSPPTELSGVNGAPAHLTSVSCATATFCMATGNMHAYKYSGGTWARGVLLERTNKLAAISCPSAGFCAVVDSAGNAFTYSGASWSPASAARRHRDVRAVVPDRHLLHGHEHRAPLFAYSAGTWSPSGPLATADGGPVHLTSVSCATATSCTATGGTNGYAYSAAPGRAGSSSSTARRSSPRSRARPPTSASPSRRRQRLHLFNRSPVISA